MSKPKPAPKLELPVKAIPVSKRSPGFHYMEARRIPGYNITRHGCDRCSLPLRPTDLVVPTGDMRHWIHAACETAAESTIEVIDVEIIHPNG